MTTRLRSGIGERRVWICGAVVFCLLANSGTVALATVGQSSTSAAQAAKKDYALIYGTVWDSNDHPVAGVPVTIRRASDKKPRWELVSDRSGEFAQRLPVGKQDYVVQANIKTSRGQAKPEVTVHIDDNERKDISLHLTR